MERLLYITLAAFTLLFNVNAQESIRKSTFKSSSTTTAVTHNRDSSVYNWMQRHNEILKFNQIRPPKIVFIGNSILHYWGGEPKAPISRGADSWKQYFENSDVRNLGFGYDRIENVLWRIKNGEIDGYNASHVVLLIGTNNLAVNKDQEILEGFENLTKIIIKKQKKAKIIILGLLPRKGYETRISVLNDKIADLFKDKKVIYTNIGKVLTKNGIKIDETLFSDGVHPNAKGYALIAPLIKEHLQQ